MSRESRVLLTRFVGIGLTFAAMTGVAQEPMAEDELARHLTTVRSQIENTTIAIDRREELTLDMAGTLDRAAQTSSNAEVRRHHWSQAVELLDWFLKENPDPPRERQLRFQSGVYRWAVARSWTETGLLDPHNAKPRAEAIRALDDAIDRFRSVAGGGNNPTLADNYRFRLAEALADRAELEPADSSERRWREAEALGLLDQAPAETGLASYWHLLKSDLSRRTGKPAEAEKEIDAALKSTPPPPQREIAEVRVPYLTEQKRYDEAIKSLESPQLEKPVRALWMVRIRLAQRRGSPAGTERFAVESDLFRWINELRSGTSLERRIAFLDLARGALEPDSKQPPEVWNVLADAYAMAGEPAKAGAEMVRAADRAAGLGQTAQAAAYRLRGGGFLFQAGKFPEADLVLSRIADDPAAGPLRAKAGMLRCLARGRALSLGMPGASSASYASALKRQIGDFPLDPSTDEARWLLGGLAIGAGDRARAETLWSAIASGSSALARLATRDRGRRSRRARPPTDQSRPA